MATMKFRCALTAERLRELLSYDPLTGVFRWKGRRKGCRHGGAAGRLAKNGYWEICVDGVLYGAHRLAWLYVHGIWPPVDIDHKDRVRHHNWIDNLREATRSQNLANVAGHTGTASGYKGVTWSKTAKRWQARICFKYRQIHIGYFDTPEEAHRAYCAKSVELNGEFAHFG